MHDAGDTPLSLATVPLACLAPGAARASPRRAFGERCRLAGTRAARVVELLLQPFVLASQAIALPFDTFEALAQRAVLVFELGSASLLRRIGFGLGRAPRHPLLMPEPPLRYKSKDVIESISRGNQIRYDGIAVPRP
jgi:hypothetical protein